MKQKPRGIIAVETSQNRKVGEVSATYVSQNSCPKTCPFRGAGCYAESGLTNFQTMKVNRSRSNVEQLATEEARAIRALSGLRHLRLHVVGDCTTDAAAKTVSDAAGEYSSRFGSVVWSYTHAWRSVRRRSWGKVSILASCETTKDARKAMKKGYAAAMVVAEHTSDKAYTRDGIKVIPCPQQTGRSANCLSCKLCFHADRLRQSGAVIGFAVHGQQVNKANEALRVIQ